MLSAWTSEVSPKLFGSFAAIWSQKISSCFCTAFREILAESSYTQTFWNNFYAMIACTFVKTGFTKNCGLKGKICQQHF